MTREEILNIAYSIGTVGEPWWLDDEDLMRFVRAVAPRLALKPGEPVAYMHCPSVAMDGKVRPVLSFEKYEGDYARGIYSERIPLFTAPQPQRDDTALLRQALEALEWCEPAGTVGAGGIAARRAAITAIQERLK
jgi:hypothetical protein